MKRKFLIAILSCLAVIFLFAGCQKAKPSFNKSNDTWGDYSFTNSLNVKVDSEVTLDGKLDEQFWANSTPLEYTSSGERLANSDVRYEGFEDATLSIKSYFSEQGMYLGVTVDDPVIYNTCNPGMKWAETNLEIYLSPQGNKELKNAKQIWIGPSDLAIFGQYLVDHSDPTKSGYFTSTAKNFGVSARMTETGFVAEAVISWEDIGCETIPDYVQMYPCFIRVKEKPYIDGSQTHVWLNFGENLGASYGEVKSWLKFKTTGYQDRKQAEPFSTYDASAFENYPAKSIQEYNGDRSLTVKAYYEKGKGLWVNSVAKHNTHVADGSFSACSNFEIQVEGKQVYTYISGGKLWGVGYSEDETMMWTVENPAGSPTNYTSYLIMFIPDDNLLELGVPQSCLDRGWLQVLGAFKTAGETAIFNEGALPAAPDWWRTEVYPVGERGYFTTYGNTASVTFANTTSKSFTYRATLNEYGLYIEAEARTDADGTSLINVEYTDAYWDSSYGNVKSHYYGKNQGNYNDYGLFTTIKVDEKHNLGYDYVVKFAVFQSYTELANMKNEWGGLIGYDEANPMESSLKIACYFHPKSSGLNADQMQFNYMKGDGTTGARTNDSAYGWGDKAQFTPVDSVNIVNLRHTVTKNGIE